jgi:AraC-like DNA-binding protein
MSASSVLTVRQCCTAKFRALFSEQPLILMVREGEKLVRHGVQEHVMARGHLGVIPVHLPLIVENRLSSRNLFIAQAIAINADLLSEFNRMPAQGTTAFRSTVHDRAVHAFERAVTSLEDPYMPLSLRENAVRDVLLWLAEEGIGFNAQQEKNFADKVRATLSKAPQDNWHITEMARQLAVSESTLRRRLAEQDTNFQALLIEVRMARALSLLQTTAMPIANIAYEAGYESPSRFAARFRVRYGVKPSDIRGGEMFETFDFNSTGNDRIGTI